MTCWQGPSGCCCNGCRCSRGGWTLDAAEAVGAGEGVTAEAVFELLARLVDKSLVLAETGEQVARYNMLETIRQYALAKLSASAEADAAQRRQAEYYLSLAEPTQSVMWNSLPAVWLDRLEMEHDNLRAALAWSLSATGDAELGMRLAGMVGWFWYWREYWSEGRNWLERALTHADAEGVNNPQARARLHAILGTTLVSLTDFAAARTQLALSQNLFREVGDTARSAWALSRLGWLAREQGDAATARLRLEESLALYNELGKEEGVAWASLNLAEVAVMLKDTAWATALLQESQKVFRRRQESLGMGWALNHLGHVAQIQGDYERARELHQESLPLFRVIGPKNLGVVFAFLGLGETALAQGDAVLARTDLTEALRLFKDMGDRTGVVPGGTWWRSRPG